MAVAARVPATNSATTAHAALTSMRRTEASCRTASASPIPAYAHPSGTRNNSARAGGGRRVSSRSSAVHPSTVRASASRRPRPSRGNSAPSNSDDGEQAEHGNRNPESERFAHIPGERGERRDETARGERYHVLVAHQRCETRASDDGRVGDDRQHAGQQDRGSEARKQGTYAAEPSSAGSLDDDPRAGRRRQDRA